MRGTSGPIALIILDGWGINKASRANAIKQAGTPSIDALRKRFPGCESYLKASGEHVGLRKGFQGNSEVGHINLGAGRLVKQMMVRIDDSIVDGSFRANKALLTAMYRCRRDASTLHIMGLVQDEGVHAMTDHGLAVLRLARDCQVKDTVFHIITDGRDTAPKSALTYIEPVLEEIRKTRGARVGTVIGRYFAMDRDNRWDRTKKAYDALVDRVGVKANDPVSAISDAYKRGQSDEFIEPVIIDNPGIKENDSVIFFNYRLDRARQLSKALCEPRFDGFKRKRMDITFVGMCEYYDGMHGIHAFDERKMGNILGKVLSDSGLRQLRLAETEKYAHVTYFFNGEQESPFKNEDRILIPSPKVATYDKTPEMSAESITQTALRDIKAAKHDVYIINFANADMVGHTGVFQKIKEAIRVTDRCVGMVSDAILARGGKVIVTADHGNAEHKEGKQKTSHTTSDVPIYIFGDRHLKPRPGKLCDVAPTLLKILGKKQPKEMTGRSLI